MASELSVDAYSPAQVANRVKTAGVAKAKLDFLSTMTLAILAGAFIALGAELATFVSVGSGQNPALIKLLGGLVFSLGLILVVVAGAELFTGNNLIVMAWASNMVSSAQLLRNWAIVYLGNLVGALSMVGLMYYSQQWAAFDFEVGANALSIAKAKVDLPFFDALVRGILCNILVCLAVWLAMSSRSVTDKVLAIVFPITAFVASGFEHSVANMYFIPMGMLMANEPGVLATTAAGGLANLSLAGFMGNLVPVTLGNIIGGGVMVAAVYWFVYLRGQRGAEGAEVPESVGLESPREVDSIAAS